MADPYADLLEAEAPYSDLLEQDSAPVEAAEPPKPKTLPRSAAAATLRALTATPTHGLAARLLAKTGALDEPVLRPGAPEVGSAETTLNKAVNALPAGGLLTDLNAAGAGFLANRVYGKALPDSAVRTLAGIPLLGNLMPTAGPGATLTPQAKKELEAMGVDTSEPTPRGLLEEFRHQRDRRRARTEAGEEQNPLAAVGGTAGGLGLSMLAPLPKFAPRGAGVGSQIAAGAKTGAAYGGLAGATSGEADLTRGEFGKAALETGAGATGGALLGGAIPGILGLGRALIGGVVRPTPAAKALQEEGVEGLTLGQMDPKSPLGAIEGTAQATPGIGTVLQGQRERAVDSLRQVALSKAVAPGAKPPPKDASIPEAIRHLRQGFNAAYDEIRDVAVPTRAVDRLLVAVDDPDIIADPATRLSVSKFLQNQMGRLPAEGTETTAGVLMKIREKVREEAFKALRANNMDRATLLERAETELTEGLNTGLPEAAAQKLRATDAQYRNFKILQDAAASAGDTAQGPGVFTPAGLSNAIDRATGETSFAEAGGGPLRNLTSAAAQAFAEPPKTGWSSLGGPFVRAVTGPLLIAGNRPGLQPFFLGQAPIQQSLQRAAADLGPIFRALNPPQAFLPQAVLEALRTTPERQ